MQLNLKKPICFFDLETTGISITSDRIVEISILKFFQTEKKKKTWLVNPEMPIPAQATAVHGISDEKVADAPTFKMLAKEINTWVKDADLGGFSPTVLISPFLLRKCYVQTLILI